jgi:hypothetical protein
VGDYGDERKDVVVGEMTVPQTGAARTVMATLNFTLNVN